MTNTKIVGLINILHILSQIDKRAAMFEITVPKIKSLECITMPESFRGDKKNKEGKSLRDWG